jgi:hypothetical protein
MSKNNIFAILGVKTIEEVKEILKYKLSPDQELSDCEFNMIINVCENYQINPNLGMLYLRRDQSNAIYPTLKVDGWYKLVNDQEDCMGFEFFESENKLNMGQTLGGKDVYIFEYIGCKIYRKGREITPLVKEYIEECFNKYNNAYFTHGNRLLRHTSFIQAARVVYNLSGIYDPSEEINFVKDNEKPVEDVSSTDFDVIGDEVVSEDEVIVTESEAVIEDEVIVTESEAVIEDKVIITEPELLTQDEVIITEPEVLTEDEVIVTESEAVTEDKVITSESEAESEADAEDKKVLVDLAIGIPDHEITQINGYLKRGKSMNKLSDCVGFLKTQYTNENYHLFIDDQAKKVA